MSERKPPVPPADRPEYEPEEYANESKETIWENPTDRDVILEIYMGGMNYGRRPRTWEEKTAQRKYIIKAKQVRAIPDEFDQAIQQTQCNHSSCSAKKRMCRDTGHSAYWDIIGGLGPQLIRHGVQDLPRLAPSLDSLQYERHQAEEKARRAAMEAEVAQNQAQIARGEAVLARQESEARAKVFADREAALLKKEKELLEREEKMKSGKKNEV